MKQNYVGIMGGVAVINIILALLALLKDIFLASYLGTSFEADALILAFFITDMIGNNLIGSSIGTSTIPSFTKAFIKNTGKFSKQDLLGVNLFALVLTSLAAILVWVLQEPIISFLGRGFALEGRGLSMEILRILIPSMLLYPVIAVGISVMQILGKFTASSLAPVLFNFIFLSGILICYFLNIPVNKGVYIISLSINAAVVSMFILVYGCIFIQRKKIFISKDAARGSLLLLKEIMKLFSPYLLILFLSQSMLYVERYIASSFSEGSVAALNYAYRLSQFPVWVFAAAISTVTFPMMSKYKGEGAGDKLGELLKKSLGLMLIVVLPMIAALYILREPIIRILFLRGAFDEASLLLTSEVLAGYSIAVLGQSITAISLKFFLSIGKMGQPLIIFFISGVCNIIFDMYFTVHLGLRALGYGAALAGIINAIIMLYFMRNYIRGSFKALLEKTYRLFIANFIILIFILVSRQLWDLYIRSFGTLFNLLYFALVALVCAAIYVAGLKRLKLI